MGLIVGTNMLWRKFTYYTCSTIFYSSIVEIRNTEFNVMLVRIANRIKTAAADFLLFTFPYHSTCLCTLRHPPTSKWQWLMYIKEHETTNAMIQNSWYGVIFVECMELSIYACWYLCVALPIVSSLVSTFLVAYIPIHLIYHRDLFSRRFRHICVRHAIA
jgi:hypothetical protein